MPETILLAFRGGARHRPENTNRNKEDAELVSHLNTRSEAIKERIRRDLKRHLPQSVTVEVEIEFSSGSVIWTGIVSVVIVMGVIGGAIEFIDYLVQGIQYVVNKVVRDEITTSPSGSTGLDFETVVISSSTFGGSVLAHGVRASFPTNGGIVPPTRSKEYVLLIGNTIGLIILLLLLIYATFRDARLFNPAPQATPSINAPTR